MMRRAIRWTGMIMALVCVGMAVLLVSACTAMGTAAQGERLLRMQASPQWKDGAFDNPLIRVDGSVVEMARQGLFNDEVTSPQKRVPIIQRTRADYQSPPASGLRVTWLGHSMLLIELEGHRILVDPVFGERASPIGWLGPQRWYEPPLPFDELPSIDAVVISHDHYDHLDYPTIERMRDGEIRWIVPLGVGAHLEGWGVKAARITELDWWEDTALNHVTVTCAPARHFSGRGLSQNNTLWAGWALQGRAHNIFYSGDTSLHPDFKTIGERLGPFDLTMMESGAYDPLWSDVHLGPEQAVLAHQMLRGKAMMPVHWGLFTLANHGWTEPIERVIAAAERVGVTLWVPRPGGFVEPSEPATIDRWWPDDVPWKTVKERPAWSTSIDEVLKTSALYEGAGVLQGSEATDAQ